MTRRRRERGLIARMVVASGLLALVVGTAFGVLLAALRDEAEASDRVRESQRVLVAANELERLVIDLETGQRGFVLTGDERFLEPWHHASDRLPEATRGLERLTFVPLQHRRAVRISEAVREYLRDYSVPLVAAARRGDPSASSMAATVQGKRLIDELRVQFDRFLRTERDVAAARQDRAQTATRRALWSAAVGLAGSLVLVAFFSAYLTRVIVGPIRRASAMAGGLASGDLTARMPETGPGEIGALERSFNTMTTSLGALLDQQASLRRVATLVARGVSPTEIFDAVAAEVGRLLAADSTRLLRYESDGGATVMAARSEPEVDIPVGTRMPLEGDNIPALVLRSGRPARMETLDGASGPAAETLRHLGIRSAVGAPVIVEGRVWGVMVTAWTRQVATSSETEERLAEFTELVGTAIANADSRAELVASRARIVAAADEARRRIERDLHDGTQQRLVSLALDLRAAETAVPADLEDLKDQLSLAAAGMAQVVENLQEVSRGIHPAILSKGGLGPALKALARRSAVPVELELRTDARLPQPVEVAAYYVVSEALANAAKHARASVVEVRLEAVDGSLLLSIRDDGVGGADPGRGSGLIGLQDRVESLGGKLEVASPPGSGTALLVTIPA